MAMLEKTDKQEDIHEEHGDVVPARMSPTEQKPKLNRHGDPLSPYPSDDPRDPLNWTNSKKAAIFGAMCFATFTGGAAAVANNLATTAQAKDFDTTPTAAAYSISAVLAGIICGPVLLVPLVRVFGCMSCVFWSELAVVATSIWSATANGPANYNSFVASRAIAGLFTSNAQIFVSGIVADIYFLHQRGKAFAIYSTVYMISVVGGPTFAGFIVQRLDWPTCFWWTVGANALAAALIFLFGDDTAWDRDRQCPVNRKPVPQSWWKKRVLLFFPGTHVVPPIKGRQIWRSFVAVFAIGFSPITILTGLYSLISFAWFIMAGVQAPILLQEPYDPPTSLGYGFDAQNTAFWYFSAWIGAMLAVGYGLLVNDRLPTWLYHRNGRVWHPEYRLHTAWVPGLLLGPLGCGLFGASVYYHLPVAVLALGECFIVFAAVASVPPSLNYTIEAFRNYPQEVGAALNVYRIGFSIAVQFFYNPWVTDVGVNWAWGTAAFVSIFAFALMGALMLFGPQLKRYNLWSDELVESDAEKDDVAS